MFGRVCDTELLDTPDDRDFVLVSNVREECRDLLQEAVDGIFRSCLEEGGNGESSDGSVGIRNEGLEFFVALGYETGMGNGHEGEGANGSKSHSRLGGRKEELQDGNGRIQVLWLGLGNTANGLGSLVDHHLGLVSERCLEELIARLGNGGGGLDGSRDMAAEDLVVEELARVSHQKDNGKGRLEGVALA
eukprot:scaffold34139_cov45-Attheya_sp.AAC.1